MNQTTSQLWHFAEPIIAYEARANHPSLTNQPAFSRNRGLLGKKLESELRARLAVDEAMREILDVITANDLMSLHPRHTDYYGLLTGIPGRTGPRVAQNDETAPEPRAIRNP